MARHRNVRNLELDAIDVDVTDDFGTSVEECLSPTQAQFMYRPTAQGTTLTDFIAEESTERTLSPYQQLVQHPGPGHHEEEVFSEDAFDDDDDMFDFDDVVGGRGHSHTGAKKGKNTAANNTKPTKKPPKPSMPPKTVKQPTPKAGASTAKASTSGLVTPMKSLAVVDSVVNSHVSRLATPSLGSGRRGGTPTQSPMPSRPKTRCMPPAARASISLVVVGHVDSGKSTLTGHMLHDLGLVSKQHMHAHRRDADRMGKASFAYAWVMDDTDDERSRGITMDIGVRHMTTEHREVTVLDAPGHKDFIPNMITGAAMADNAMLVVNGTRGEFESGFDDGGQTREHAQLVRSLGVTHLLVAVNKLDTVDWDEQRYRHICGSLKTYLTKTVGFPGASITFVPVSALSGANLATRPEPGHPLTKWYNGQSLVEFIGTQYGIHIRNQADGMRAPPSLDLEPLRLSVTSVYRGTSGVTTVCGRVLQGTIDTGDTVLIEPQHVTASVKSVTSDGGPSSPTTSTVYSGSLCTMVLTGAALEGVTLTTGSIVCHPDHAPLVPMDTFTLKVLVFATEVPLLAGQPVEVHAHNMSEAAHIVKLVALLDKKTGARLPRRPRCLPSHSSGVMTVSTTSPVCVSPTDRAKAMCRVTLRNEGHTIAAGVLTTE